MVYLIELKIMVIKMFTQLGRKVYENSENFQKMIENVRKFQTEVITELKSTLEGFKSRLDEAEERMSELKEKAMKLRMAKLKRKSEDTLRDIWGNTK